MSNVIDILGAGGIALIAWGLYLWRPCFALVFAGVVLLWIARTLDAAANRNVERK